MLKKLYIKNYALIDTLDIHFDKGLNIITGETGAGKSIVMGALGLILGNRVEGKYLFNEQSKCIIEGYFDVSAYLLHDFFVEQDIDYADETIIRREINPDGRSRAFINDSPVTLQTLKMLGELLIDIHSQHATLQINTEKFQLLILDSVSSNQETLQAYQRSLKKYKQTKSTLQELEADIAKSNAELDYHQFVFNELEAAAWKDDEVERLESEQQQLENAEEIKRRLSAAHHYLHAADNNVTAILRETISEVQKIATLIPAGDELLSRLDSCLIELKDLANELSIREQEVVMDEARLSLVSDRLSLLYQLIQKYRVSDLSALSEFKNEIEAKIQGVSDQQDQRTQLQLEVQKLHKETHDIATKLSENRTSVIDKVTANIQQTLHQVGMPNAVLSIELRTSEKFTELGVDKVAFLFSANKGQTLQPISKVASGGELSRVMLAIKSLVAASSALPTIIFDEIDTGISGEVALQVGEVMESLSANMQVIAITHLPQIAAKGNQHFKVYKEDTNERTISRMEALNETDRIQEIAKMLSGATPGEAAIQHAKELLKN